MGLKNKMNNPVRLNDFQDIPEPLRAFVKDREDFIVIEPNGDITIDCWDKSLFEGVMFIFSKENKEKVIVQVDHVESLKALKSEVINELSFSESVKEGIYADFQEAEKKLVEAIQNAGYEWEFSHRMARYDVRSWWHISFPVEAWNEKTFLAIWKLVDGFNEKLRKLMP